MFPGESPLAIRGLLWMAQPLSGRACASFSFQCLIDPVRRHYPSASTIYLGYAAFWRPTSTCKQDEDHGRCSLASRHWRFAACCGWHNLYRGVLPKPPEYACENG
jgi:hypothetical protein